MNTYYKLANTKILQFHILRDCKGLFSPAVTPFLYLYSQKIIPAQLELASYANKKLCLYLQFDYSSNAFAMAACRWKTDEFKHTYRESVEYNSIYTELFSWCNCRSQTMVSHRQNGYRFDGRNLYSGHGLSGVSTDSCDTVL